MIIYLTAPIFSLAERTFNEEFAASLERNFFPSQVLLPQSNAVCHLDAQRAAARLFEMTVEAIKRCDAVVAILDGADAEAGTCVALGYAKAKNKVIIGLRTDFRQGEDRGLNLMVSNICTHLIVRPSTSVTLDELTEEVATLLNLTVCTDVVLQPETLARK